jgi:hypothetical protein
LARYAHQLPGQNFLYNIMTQQRRAALRRAALKAAIALGLAFALCPSVLAATYTDEMANIYADQFRKPFNMKYHYFAGAVPDYSTLTPAGKGPAYIDYTVADAMEVTVSFYSRNGTFVKFDEEMGKYRMGVYGQSMGVADGQAPLPQAMLCPVSGEVYTLEGGLKWLAFDDFSGQYYFEERPQHAPPQAGPLGYGFNIFYSADGEAFERATAEISYLYYDISTSLVYETYKAKVPAQARVIRVTLDEMEKLRYTDKPEPRDYYANSPLGATGLALAAMSVYGDSLVVGVSDPLVRPKLPQDDYAEPPESSSQPIGIIVYGYREERREEAPGSSRQLSEESAKVPEENLGPQSSSSSSKAAGTSSSKFSGVISEGPESASRKSAEKQPESDWLPDDEYWAAAEPPAQTPPEAEPAPIQIAAAQQEDIGFTRGVTAYIVLASGGLAALVLFKPKK